MRAAGQKISSREGLALCFYWLAYQSVQPAGASLRGHPAAPFSWRMLEHHSTIAQRLFVQGLKEGRLGDEEAFALC